MKLDASLALFSASVCQLAGGKSCPAAMGLEIAVLFIVDVDMMYDWLIFWWWFVLVDDANLFHYVLFLGVIRKMRRGQFLLDSIPHARRVPSHSEAMSGIFVLSRIP